MHSITTVIEKTLEEKNVCPTIFLDVAQAFDKVWHEELFHKIGQLPPTEHSQLLKSYLIDTSELRGRILKAQTNQGCSAAGKCIRPGPVPAIHERPPAT